MLFSFCSANVLELLFYFRKCLISVAGIDVDRLEGPHPPTAVGPGRAGDTPPGASVRWPASAEGMYKGRGALAPLGPSTGMACLARAGAGDEGLEWPLTTP